MKSIINRAVLGLWCTFISTTVLAVEFKGSPGTWKGFNQITFQVDGRDAYVVLPETPLEGNPWVLRARFPDFHTEVDEQLLKQGYIIGHINVANLYGSPQAIQHWDAFYALMQSKGMAKKVVLEGVSRGGLICYNWAKRNPEKVACIYLEAPVCDIKSWPGGKGAGKGSSNDWEKVQKAYGVDESGLMVWDNNPIDHLESLAQAKVPIFTSIGLQDRIVPPAENTFKLMERYIGLGGPFMVYPMTRGKQQLEGHHFPIECPELIVDFILSHNVLK